MNISWFSRADKKSFATIYKTNITVNKTGSEKISNAYACLLGLDKEQKLIILKPISKDQADEGTVDKDMMFILSGSSTYTRVSSTDFVNEVSSLTSYDYSTGKKKYLCYYDSKENVLVIDLKKEVN